MSSLFRISEKFHYAFVLCAALVDTYNVKKFISLNSIAAKFHLSQGYLEEIAHLLAKAKIITSSRGFGGGYALSEKPEKLHIVDIIHSLQGATKANKCSKCRAGKYCSTKSIMELFENMFEDYFKKISLAQSLKPKKK